MCAWMLERACARACVWWGRRTKQIMMGHVVYPPQVTAFTPRPHLPLVRQSAHGRPAKPRARSRARLCGEPAKGEIKSVQ